MTSWWRHCVQISVEIHLNEQAQERFHLDRKGSTESMHNQLTKLLRQQCDSIRIHSTWMRCMLKGNRSWGFYAFQYSVCDENKERENKIRMHLRNRFFFSGRARCCPSHWFRLDARTAWRDLPTRAGCPVLDSVLLLFLKHTNIWFFLQGSL